MRLLACLASVLVLVFATACGGSATTPSGQPGGNPGGSNALPTVPPAPGATPGGLPAAATCATEAAAGAAVISMEGSHSLSPSDSTVKVGDSVTWTNNSSTTHKISFDTGPQCGYTPIGKSASIKFDTPGQFHYVCKIHPTYMSGTITVQ